MISARELSGTDSNSLLRRRVAGSIARRVSVRYRTFRSTAHRLSRTTEEVAFLGIIHVHTFLRVGWFYVSRMHHHTIAVSV
jgi:hypothetical protein